MNDEIARSRIMRTGSELPKGHGFLSRNHIRLLKFLAMSGAEFFALFPSLSPSSEASYDPSRGK